MTDDTRELWEIAWNVRIEFAASYIKYLTLTGRERSFAASAYTTNGELERWALEQIGKLIKKANAMVAENGDVSIAALDAAQPYLEKLAAVVWPSGTVPPVVTLKIDRE